MGWQVTLTVPDRFVALTVYSTAPSEPSARQDAVDQLCQFLAAADATCSVEVSALVEDCR